MLEYTELDNRITKSQLSKTFPNKVNIGFGLDANKIKGVNHFPIYNETDGFKSHAKANVDSFMFHSSNKYDVAKATHTSVGEIQPYYYDKKSPPHPKDTNIRMRAGEMQSLFGLPPDKTIVLENPTAQAMNMMGGKMTERKMRDHIWRKEASGLDPRLQSIIDGDEEQGSASASATTPNNNDIPTEEDTKVPPPARKTPAPRAKTVIKPVVSQAFPKEETKEVLKEETKEVLKEETKEVFKEDTKEDTKEGDVRISTKNEIKEEMSQIFRGSDPSQQMKEDERTKMDNLLTNNGFDTPKKSIKIILTYMNAVQEILEKSISTKTKRTPSKAKKDTEETKMFFEKERGEDR